MAALGVLARRLFHRLPDPAQARIRRTVRPVRWGNLRRLEPVDPIWGFGRGTPVDRLYIAEFLARHAADVRGHVLEVGSDRYVREHRARITKVDIVDVVAENPHATIIADVADVNSLPAGTFDCVVITQTLQYVRDLDAAFANLWQSLAPGGVVLLSIPALAKRDPDEGLVDRWRLLPGGLTTLLERTCPEGEVEVVGFGNVLVAAAAVFGIAAEELTPEEIAAYDAQFPILTCARLRRPLV